MEIYGRLWWIEYMVGCFTCDCSCDCVGMLINLDELFIFKVFLLCFPHLSSIYSFSVRSTTSKWDSFFKCLYWTVFHITCRATAEFPVQTENSVIYLLGSPEQTFHISCRTHVNASALQKGAKCALNAWTDVVNSTTHLHSFVRFL